MEGLTCFQVTRSKSANGGCMADLRHCNTKTHHKDQQADVGHNITPAPSSSSRI